MPDIEKEELLKLYNEKILPKMEQFEKERKVKFFKYILKQIACILLMIGFFLPTYLILRISVPDVEINTGIFIYIVPMVVIFIICIDTQTEFRDFSKKLKEAFSKDIIDLLNQNKDSRIVSMEYYAKNAFLNIYDKNCECNQLEKHLSFSLLPTRYAINGEELRKSLLFRAFNNIFYDDKFVGVHNGIKFTVAEIALKSGKNSTSFVHEENIIPIKMFCHFSGVVILFDYNKKINAYTTIKTKGLEFHFKKTLALFLAIIMLMLVGLFIYLFFKSGFSIFFILMSLFFVVQVLIALYWFYMLWTTEDVNRGALKKVNLEDFKFKNKFDVLSEDQIEARYLISPSFMERLYNLKTVFNSKKMRCAFYNDKFIIALETKEDFFELGKLSKSLLKNNMAEKFYNQIKGIYDLIDELKIDSSKII